MLRPFPLTALCVFSLTCTAAVSLATPTNEQLVAQMDNARGEALQQLKQQIVQRGMAMHELLWQSDDAMSDLRVELRRQIRARRDDEAAARGRVVHEWGSVRYLQNQSGGIVGGMSEDQSDLPAFVQVWSKQPVIDMQIIEKPVIYFYTDKRMNVNVHVTNPNGLITQWYPRATQFQPQRQSWQPQIPARNGQVVWNSVELNPSTPGDLVDVPRDHPWWHVARDVDAATLSVNGDTEKFLFYRGTDAGGAQLRVDQFGEATYKLTNTTDQPIEHVVMLRVHNGKATYHYVRRVPRGYRQTVKLTMDEAKPLDEQWQQQATRFTECLEAHGLFPKEAAGITKIWGRDWFAAEGIRLLYIMPQAHVDQMLRLNISPKPAATVRSIVVQVECVTPDLNERIERLVKQLGDESYDLRAAAQRELLKLDRFAEAVLREQKETADDPEVRERVERILDHLQTKRQQFDQVQIQGGGNPMGLPIIGG